MTALGAVAAPYYLGADVGADNPHRSRVRLDWTAKCLERGY